MMANNRENNRSKNIFNRTKLKVRSPFEIFLNIIIIIAIAMTFYTLFFKIDYKWEQFSPSLAKKIIREILRFDLVSKDIKLEMIRSLINTLILAFLSSFLGFVIGLPLALIGAKNLGNKYIVRLIKSVTGLMRAIPTIIWVLIFVSAYGLSATTGVIGMFFHSLSFFTRSLSETFEEVDSGVIEGLTASGANKIQLIMAAIIPSSISQMIFWFGMRLEQDFAIAVIIGPAVGVPGTIGTFINNSARIGDISALGFGIFLIFITATIMELLINKFKNRYISD